jgi:hypothetical protein
MRIALNHNETDFVGHPVWVAFVDRTRLFNSTTLWYWRCEAEMPMLDEREFQQVTSLGGKGMRLRDAFVPVMEEYERITGLKETNPNAIYHHRPSLYGDPCRSCGKPLRTPRAKLCGSCMQPVGEVGLSPDCTRESIRRELWSYHR